jgi:TIR domain/Tetratricopeptide repeat
MSQAAKIFVSHTQQDAPICRQIVDALRQAGADVWYDEHNLGSDQLGPTIERELRARPLFVVILSPAALKSRWVEDETRRAYSLFRMDGGRTILPVLAEQIAGEEIWLFLLDFKRVEGPNLTPYPPEVAVTHLLRALSLSRPGEPPVAEPPPEESAEELMTRGLGLHSQGKPAEALAAFEQALVLDPTYAAAMGNRSQVLQALGRS